MSRSNRARCARARWSTHASRRARLRGARSEGRRRGQRVRHCPPCGAQPLDRVRRRRAGRRMFGAAEGILSGEERWGKRLKQIGRRSGRIGRVRTCLGQIQIRVRALAVQNARSSPRTGSLRPLAPAPSLKSPVLPAPAGVLRAEPVDKATQSRMAVYVWMFCTKRTGSHPPRITAFHPRVPRSCVSSGRCSRTSSTCPDSCRASA